MALMFKLFITGVAAVALAACGGLGGASGSPAGSTNSANSDRTGTVVGGKLSSLSGGKLVLTGQNRTVTVTYDSSTRIQQTTTGSLSDVTTGSCVTAAGQDDGAGGLTAVTLAISPATNGSCAAPGGGGQGRSGGGGTAGGNNGGPGAFGGAGLSFVRGKVTAVSGGSVTVQPATGGAVTMDVLGNARITKMGTAGASALAVGQCVTAAGQADSSGAVKARTLSITPPGPNGTCTTPFGGRGRPTPGSTTA